MADTIAQPDAKSQPLSRKERRQLKHQQKAQELLPLQQKLAESLDEEERLAAVQEFRELLVSASAPSMDVLLCTEVVPGLLQWCSSDSEDGRLQFEALMAVSDLVEYQGASHHMGELIDMQLLENLEGPVASPHARAREVAIKVLVVVALASSEACSAVMHSAVTLAILRMLVNREIEQPELVVRQGASLIGAVCCWERLFDEEAHLETDAAKLLWATLAELIMSSDEEVLAPTCTALSKLHYEKMNLALLWKQGVCQRLVFLFTQPTVSIATGACAAARYIAEGTEAGMQALIECEPIKPLKEMLDSDEVTIQREGCLLLACIVKGGKVSPQEIVDAGVGPRLTRLRDSGSINVKEAASDVLGALA